MSIPSLADMLKAGVHFGHQTGKWHPKMEPYLFAERSGIHVIDLEKTQTELEKAAAFVTDLVAKGGVVMFVGTKKQAKDIIATHAADCGMPYVHQRWLGGILTNFSVISKMIKKYKDLKEKQTTGGFKGYTKKERLDFDNEIADFEERLGGLANLKKLPDALFVIDIKKEKTAVAEANVCKIPIVAVCDSNANPDKVQHVIPGNDDAVKSIELFAQVMAEAVKAGQEKAKSQPAKPAAKKAEQKPSDK